jgi:DNA polymerase III alpha subunit (gram-positive type)
MLFSQFVRPTNPIPPFITELTSITNNNVSTGKPFPAAGNAFVQFMQQHMAGDENHNGPIDPKFLWGTKQKGIIYTFPPFSVACP